MAPPFSEQQLANAVGQHLRLEGWTLYREVPLLSRCVDMIATRDDGEFMAIEFKLDNWRRAITQARDHVLACDMAVICMPRRRASEAMMAALNDEGLGYFVYDADEDRIERVLLPRRSSLVSPIARQWLQETIHSRRGCHDDS